jgi:hypothetical protein
VPAVIGAVYRPVAVTLPPPTSATDQLALVLIAPFTVAANCTVVAACAVALRGVTAMDTPAGVGAVTVIVARPDLVGFAVLVAITVYTPGACGAV